MRESLASTKVLTSLLSSTEVKASVVVVVGIRFKAALAVAEEVWEAEGTSMRTTTDK